MLPMLFCFFFYRTTVCTAVGSTRVQYSRTGSGIKVSSCTDTVKKVLFSSALMLLLCASALPTALILEYSVALQSPRSSKLAYSPLIVM